MIEIMRDEKTQIAILILVTVFILILIPFRKIICYPFCSLETYTGKAGKGKSNYFFLFHLIISLAITLACYVFINENRNIEFLFENTFLRLGTILIMWLVWGFIVGWLIEIYLESSDQEYKKWKKTRYNK